MAARFGVIPARQGRPLSTPFVERARVQTDGRFITVASYVERDALRAKLVERAEDWRWASLFQFKQNGAAGFDFLIDWPTEGLQNWVEFVNAPDNALELNDLRSRAQRGNNSGLSRP